MAAYIPENLPEGMEPGLEELAFYDPENFVFPFGAHACVVEVDPETGNVDVVKYAAVDDCGPAINPKIIDGQVHGGIVHAIGQALFERIHYNEDGQLVTGNVRRLRAPERGGRAVLRPGPHGDPVAGQLARREGHRRGGHDRRLSRGHQRRHRRPAPARRDVHQHATRPAAGLGSDPGGEGVIPAEFDYVAPGSLDDALKALADGGEDAKVLAGGHSLIPLMKLRLAAPSLIVDLRQRGRAARASRPTATRSGSARWSRHHEVATGGYGLASAAAATIADQQVRNMGTIGGTLAHGDPASDMPAVLLALEGSVIDPRVRRRARGRGRRLVRGLPRRRRVGEGEILTEVRFPKLEGYGYGYEKFNRRQEDWAMVAVSALVKKAATARARTCASGSPTWARRRCGRPRPRRRCAGSRWTPTRSPPPPSRPRRAPSRRRT